MLHARVREKTGNRSGICDDCWGDRDQIYADRKAKEAVAEKRPLSPAQRAALEKRNATRMAKLAQDLPIPGTSNSEQ